MSNIVARLTNLIKVSENECERKFYTELRTEIDRLRAENDWLKKLLEEARLQHTELAAEIERLHRQLVSDINAETEIDRLETEIERLRAELPEARLRGYDDGVAAGAAAERERCARICDMRAAVFRKSDGECALSLTEECEDLAAAIRKDEP